MGQLSGVHAAGSVSVCSSPSEGAESLVAVCTIIKGLHRAPEKISRISRPRLPACKDRTVTSSCETD